MATLTVDQAVHRLVHGVSRNSSSDVRLLNNNNSSSRPIFGNKSTTTATRNQRNGSGQSRYSHIGATQQQMGGNRIGHNNNEDHLYLTPLHRRTKSSSIGGHQHHQREGISTTNGGGGGASMEVQRCLKNIIVSQASYLNHQEQLAVAKEKEIYDLRRENSALKFALRSFEKRHSTSSTTTVAQQCNFADFVVDVKHPLNGQDDSKLDNNGGGDLIDGKNRRRCSSITKAPPPDLEQRLIKHTRISSSDNHQSSVNVAAGETGGGVDSSLVGRLRSGRRRTSIDSDRDHHHQQQQIDTPSMKRPLKREAESPETLTRGVRLSTSIAPSSKRRKTSSTPYKEVVQIPAWRICSYAIGGSLEGTENITDEALAKRHQKGELEERRVIRRDKMRQREEQLKEKLASRGEHLRLSAANLLKRERNDSESSSSSPVVTAAATEPDSYEVEGIEICDHLPKSCKTPTSGSSSKSRKKSKK